MSKDLFRGSSCLMAKLSPLHQLREMFCLVPKFLQRCKVHTLCLTCTRAEITLLFESSSCYLPWNFTFFFFNLTAFVPSFTMNIVLLRTKQRCFQRLQTAPPSVLLTMHIHLQLYPHVCTGCVLLEPWHSLLRITTCLNKSRKIRSS